MIQILKLVLGFQTDHNLHSSQHVDGLGLSTEVCVLHGDDGVQQVYVDPTFPEVRFTAEFDVR